MKTSTCPIRILLIDDDQRFADTARHKLGTAGLRTALDSAPSLTNAFSRLDKKSFDIVILNPYFGRVQGEAAYLAVRQHAWNMPVLLMVSAQHEAPALSLLDLGADDYVIKETTRPTLLWHTAQSIIKRCTLRQRLRILETVKVQNKRARTDLKAATLQNVEKALKTIVLNEQSTTPETTPRPSSQDVLLKQHQTFTTAIAHDFKAPLSGAILATEIIRDGRLGPLTDEQRVVINQLQSSHRQMLRLATNMVELHAQQEKNIRLSPAAFNLKDFIHDCVFSVMPLAIANEVRIVTDVALKFENYYADQDALRLVMANLLDNALSFSPRGGSVSLIARSIAKEIVIRVIDQGPNLNEEQQSQAIGSIWSDQDNPRYTAATALALHVCNKIVSSYGGSIRCFTVSPEETAWEVALPLVHETNPQ